MPRTFGGDCSSRDWRKPGLGRKPSEKPDQMLWWEAPLYGLLFVALVLLCIAVWMWIAHEFNVDDIFRDIITRLAPNALP